MRGSASASWTRARSTSPCSLSAGGKLSIQVLTSAFQRAKLKPQMMCLNPQGRSDAVLAEYVYLTNPVEHQTSGLSVRRQCRMEVQMNAERLIDDPVEIDVLPRTFRRLRPCTQWPGHSATFLTIGLPTVASGWLLPWLPALSQPAANQQSYEQENPR
jgi:hypothetical protein